MYINTESLCCTLETNRISYVNSTSIKIKRRGDGFSLIEEEKNEQFKKKDLETCICFWSFQALFESTKKRAKVLGRGAHGGGLMKLEVCSF